MVVGLLSTEITTFPAPWIAVAFVMYMVPVRLPCTEALWSLAGTILVAAIVLADPYGGPGPNRVTLIAGMALLITTARTIGYAVRQQRMYAASIRERAAGGTAGRWSRPSSRPSPCGARPC